MSDNNKTIWRYVATVAITFALAGGASAWFRTTQIDHAIKIHAQTPHMNAVSREEWLLMLDIVKSIQTDVRELRNR